MCVVQSVDAEVDQVRPTKYENGIEVFQKALENFYKDHRAILHGVAVFVIWLVFTAYIIYACYLDFGRAVGMLVLYGLITIALFYIALTVLMPKIEDDLNENVDRSLENIERLGSKPVFKWWVFLFFVRKNLK